MQNPAVQRAMTNPRVLQAINQIQTGIQQLQQDAPELLPILGMTPSPTLSSFQSSTTTTTPSATTATSSTTAGSGTTSSATTTTSSPPVNPMLSQMFQNILQQQMNPGAQAQQLPPAERFRSQLEQLAGMGFVDRDANLRGKSSLTLRRLALSKIVELLINSGLFKNLSYCYIQRRIKICLFAKI